MRWDLSQYIPPPISKGQDNQITDWIGRDKEFLEDTILESIYKGIMTAIQEDIDDNETDYINLDPEYWIDFCC